MLHPRLKLPTIKYWPQANPQGGDVGIEIELEGDNLPTGVAGWQAKRDNSLRGANGRVCREDEEDRVDTPREYVTNGAIPLRSVPLLANALVNSLRPETVVRISPRTSTHIHVNMQDCTVGQVIGYMIAWAIIEPLLLRLCGPERNGNLFCLPFSETYDMASSIIPQWLSAIEHYSGGRYWNKRGKYACLNTDPLHTFGSVEARCFPATTDAKKLTEWVSWVTNVKSWVRESEDETYEELIDSSYRDPEGTIRKIFGDYPVGSHTYPNTPSELIRSGVETAYEIWKAFQPVFNYKEPIKKGKKFATAELNDFWSSPETVMMPPVPNPELYFTEDDD